MSSRITITYIAATSPTSLANSIKDVKSDTWLFFCDFNMSGSSNCTSVLTERTLSRLCVFFLVFFHHQAGRFLNVTRAPLRHISKLSTPCCGRGLRSLTCLPADSLPCADTLLQLSAGPSALNGEKRELSCRNRVITVHGVTFSN